MTVYTLTATATDSVTGQAGSGTAPFTVGPFAHQATIVPGSRMPNTDTGIPGPFGNYIVVAGYNASAHLQSYTFSWAGAASNAFGAVVSDSQVVGSAGVSAYPGNTIYWGDPGLALSSLPHLYATWAQRMPQVATVESECMFDMYFATVGNPASTFELMVWPEAHNTPHYTASGGGITAVAQNVTVNGLNWDVWHWTGNGSTFGGWAFDLSSPAQRTSLLKTASHFDLVPFINWMWSSGQMTYANPAIQFCAFGWEIWSTSGQPATWTCDQFSLSYT